MHKNAFFTCILAIYLNDMKRNVPILGFIIGALLPLLGMYLFHFVVNARQPFGAFIDSLMHQHQLAAKVLTVSILINLVPFLLFTSRRLDYSARGVFIATMLYALLIILLKFVW